MITAQPRAEAADQCRDMQAEGPGASYTDELANADVAIAEQRGVWTTVVLAGTDGFSAMCIADDSAGLFTGGMIGSLGPPNVFAPPGPGELIATSLGRGTMSAGDISMAAGIAGPDVEEVVYTSPTYGDVTATVSHGHFALWLPGDELEGASSSGIEVEITYRDGTTDTRELTL